MFGHCPQLHFSIEGRGLKLSIKLAQRFLIKQRKTKAAKPIAAMRIPHEKLLPSGHKLGYLKCKYTPNPITPRDPKISQFNRMIVSCGRNDSLKHGKDKNTQDKVNAGANFENFIFNSLSYCKFFDHCKDPEDLQLQSWAACFVRKPLQMYGNTITRGAR